ncbi:hypothetical protein [Halorubrum trueperi]|uniref:DUF8055 domain-containing protein n=1 Tax=Halorubrum trueperi TaxID=2004704 RepID=A0ABD5UMD6_9EURY
MTPTRSRYADRIASLAADARATRARFDPDFPRKDDRDGADDGSQREPRRGDGESMLAEDAPLADGEAVLVDGESVLADGESRHTMTDRVRTELEGTAVSNPEEAALVAARDGLGPVVGVYVEARTADEPVRFSQRELDRLHAATSDWLAVYARCRGIDADPDATVREAAELLVDTHDVTDVAALLTGTHRGDS